MPEKITCPNCGAENYTTDTVCMSCGASLTKSDPTTSQQREQPESEEQRGAPMPTERAEPPTQPQEEETVGMSALAKAILVSVGIGVIEMLIVAFTYGETAGAIPLKGMVSLLIGGIVYGGLRGLMLGFLLKETKWSPSIALLLGLGLAFSFARWPNYLFGAIAGFVIGTIIEKSLPAQPPRI